MAEGGCLRHVSDISTLRAKLSGYLTDAERCPAAGSGCLREIPGTICQIYLGGVSIKL